MIIAPFAHSVVPPSLWESSLVWLLLNNSSWGQTAYNRINGTQHKQLVNYFTTIARTKPTYNGRMKGFIHQFPERQEYQGIKGLLYWPSKYLYATKSLTQIPETPAGNLGQWEVRSFQPTLTLLLPRLLNGFTPVSILPLGRKTPMAFHFQPSRMSWLHHVTIQVF